MKTEQVTEFVAVDGARFKDRDRCVEYEAELAAVAPFLAMLPETDLNHGIYAQHEAEPLREAKRGLYALVVGKNQDADKVHVCSTVGRVMDDSGLGPLSKAWTRLAFFNFDLGREYDQPYFANHPDEATEASADHRP